MKEPKDKGRFPARGNYPQGYEEVEAEKERISKSRENPNQPPTDIKSIGCMIVIAIILVFLYLLREGLNIV